MKAENIDTESVDHAADETRYACMAGPWLKMRASRKGIAARLCAEAGVRRNEGLAKTLEGVPVSEEMLKLVLGQVLGNQAAIMTALSKHQPEGATKEMLASHTRATDTVLNLLNGVSAAAEPAKP